MDLDKLAEKLKDLIVGELKEEFRDFKATVSGELAGFRLVVESLNQRMASLESRQKSLEAEMREIKRMLEYINQRIDETNKRIDDTNKRIDDVNKRIDETNEKIDKTRAELKAEIAQNTQRIDYLYIEVSKIRGDLNRALSQKEIIDDMLIRIQRLEMKVFESRGGD